MSEIEMSDEGQRPTDEQIAAYVDGTMSDQKRAAFEARLRHHPDLAAECRMQSLIDESLQRQFDVAAPSEQQLAALLDQHAATHVTNKLNPRHRSLRLALLALAAVIAWIVVGWQLVNRDEQPAFKPRSLAAIYQATVAKGFEPYYECREPDRFAETFARRQGVRLQLNDMPADRYMLGLSYPGGLSRMTTAMLCRVDEQPVMVFVDKQEVDRAQGEDLEAGLSLLRQQRDGLVFYEITPVPEKSMIEYLIVE